MESQNQPRIQFPRLTSEMTNITQQHYQQQSQSRRFYHVPQPPRSTEMTNLIQQNVNYYGSMPIPNPSHPSSSSSSSLHRYHPQIVTPLPTSASSSLSSWSEPEERMRWGSYIFFHSFSMIIIFSVLFTLFLILAARSQQGTI